MSVRFYSTPRFFILYSLPSLGTGYRGRGTPDSGQHHGRKTWHTECIGHIYCQDNIYFWYVENRVFWNVFWQFISIKTSLNSLNNWYSTLYVFAYKIIFARNLPKCHFLTENRVLFVVTDPTVRWLLQYTSRDFTVGAFLPKGTIAYFSLQNLSIFMLDCAKYHTRKC